MQTFFFIPLLGLQTCIVPVISFNYTTKSYARCRETMKDSFLFSCVFMLLGTVCFMVFPTELLRLFSDSSEVIAIGRGRTSLFLSVMRQILCLIPIFWALSLIGLRFTWFAFPISEVIVGAVGMMLYRKTVMGWKRNGN